MPTQPAGPLWDPNSQRQQKCEGVPGEREAGQMCWQMREQPVGVNLESWCLNKLMILQKIQTNRCTNQGTLLKTLKVSGALNRK